MRIWYQTMTSYGYESVWDEYGEIVTKQCKRVLRPDTEVHVAGVSLMMREVEKYASVETLHHLQVLTNMVRAENEGYDAFAINCSCDPFLNEGKEMLSIPVVGISQTCYHFAAMLGDLFAVIASSTVFSERYRRLVAKYGLRDKYLPGPYTLNMAEEQLARGLKDPEPIAEKFKAVARKAIADGASVLIPLPGFIATCLYKVGLTTVDDVLVIDPVAVTVKTAEAMVDLKAAGIEASRKIGTFGSPSKELRANAFKKYADALKIS